MSRRNFIAGAFAVALLGHSACSWADALENVQKSKNLRVAILQDYPPFGFAGPSMKPAGLDIELAELVAKKLGVELTMLPANGPNRIPYLQTNKVDIIIGCLGKNAEREKVIDFSTPYAGIYNGVFGPADISVKAPEDLKGHSISVSRGSTEDLALSKIAPSTANIRRFEDSNGAISAFLSGQAELLATGSVTAAAIIKKGPARSPLSKFKINDELVYVGLSKNEPKLMAKINEILAAAKADGSLNALSLKWLGNPLPSNL